MKFVLLNKDQALFEFETEVSEFGDVYVYEPEEYECTLPLGFKSLENWLSLRRAPVNRKNIKEILGKAGCYNLEGYLRVTHALSLNDTYWVREIDSDLTWNDVSLYRNEFDEAVANTALGIYVPDELNSVSPEFSTNGMYAKCWIRDNGIKLCKCGSDTYGVEPCCEVLASRISKVLCNGIEYVLSTYKGKSVSMCDLFTSEEFGFVPAMCVINNSSIGKVDTLLKYYDSMGYGDWFRRMIVLDAVIVNEDRHPGNFGFYVNNDTQVITGPAPVFDLNRSLLFGLKGEYDDKSVRDYLSCSIPRIGADFINTAKKLLSNSIRSELKNLKYFEFDEASKIPSSFVDGVSRIITFQIQEILGEISVF